VFDGSAWGRAVNSTIAAISPVMRRDVGHGALHTGVCSANIRAGAN